MISLSGISQEECKTNATYIFSKSEELWKCGEEIQLKYPDIALTNFITSVEELVKANILICENQGYKLKNIKGIDLFFRDHLARYTIFFALSAFSILPDLLREFGSKKVRGRFLGYFSEGKKPDKRVLKVMMRKLFNEIIKRAELFDKLFDIRNKGLYYDINGIAISNDHRKFIVDSLDKVHDYLRGNFQMMIEPQTEDDHEATLQLKSLMLNQKNRDMLELFLTHFPEIRKKKNELINKLILGLGENTLSDMFKDEDILFDSLRDANLDVAS